MNRHIYGLTLFLIIVKTHFLLYWAFFAPINFYSTQEKIVIVESPQVIKRSCNLKNKLSANLRNVAIDAKKGYVTANVDLNNLESVSDLSKIKMRIHIFSENLRPVWSGEISPAYFGSDSAIEFKKYAPELADLSRNNNYYAQVEVLPRSDFYNDKLVYRINQATPVLLVSGTTGNKY